MQGSLIILTAAWTAFAVLSSAQKVVASIVAVNLTANLAFFLSHPIFTPYYLMPLAMLSISDLIKDNRYAIRIVAGPLLVTRRPAHC